MATQNSALPTFDITEDPISPEMKEQLRLFLMKSYDYSSMQLHRTMLFLLWRDAGEDDPWLEDPSDPAVRILHPPALDPDDLKSCCNKSTTLYTMPSARKSIKRGSMLLPFACIFKEWVQQHNNSPSIEYHQFFATLSTVLPKEPQTISEIIKMHLAVCTQASTWLVQIRKGEGSKICKSLGGPWEDPKNWTIRRIYFAIILVLDKYSEPIHDDENDPRAVDLSRHSRRQTVLMVRTGAESRLNFSAPISFEELRANGDCLPLSREDVSDPDPNVVRVTLETAVQFICGLERRENRVIASPKFSEGAKKSAADALKYTEQKRGEKMSVFDKRHGIQYAIECIVAGNYCEEEWSQRWSEPQDPFNRSWN